MHLRRYRLLSEYVAGEHLIQARFISIVDIGAKSLKEWPDGWG